MKISATFLVIMAGGLATATRGAPQEDRQKTIDALMAKLEATQAQYYNVPREDGRWLNLLIKMIGAKKALEVGAANGYSGIWIGLGLEATGGSLTTIEIDGKKAKEARENFAKVGLSERIKVIEGDAHKIVWELEGPFDFIFIDADMGRDLDYYEALFPKLSPGGIMIRHNAIKYASTMKDYLDAVKKNPELDTVILSLTMEDGFCLSWRKRK